MGFSVMPRRWRANYLKKACLNIEENRRYVLNVLKNSFLVPKTACWLSTNIHRN